MRALLVPCLILSGACAAVSSAGRATVISPAQSGNPGAWSAAEQAAPLTIRNLQRTDGASYHLIRASQGLPRRVHEHSDLVLVVVAGDAKLSLGDENVSAKPGTVVEIPRGTPYGALASGQDATVFYAVFTPALAAGDTREQAQSQSASSWRWNLWPQ